MKTYQKTIISIIIIILCILAYISKKNQAQDLNVPVQVSTSKTFNEENEFYSIKATTPIESRDTNSVMQKMADTAIATHKEAWKIGGALYNEEKNIAAQYPDRPFIKYELNIQYEKFQSQLKDTVSYVFKNYEFTGGAHGNTGLITYTFNSTGLVDIKDILNLDGENDTKLTKIVALKLKENLGEMYNEDLLIGGLGLASEFTNFVVLDEGIQFIFGQYQVAPYAAGMPEVLVTWDELKNYVK